MRTATSSSAWRLFFHDTDALSPDEMGLVDPETAALIRESRDRPRRRGTPFFIAPDGIPDDILNDYFRSAGPGAALADTSARSYAYDMLVFLSILGQWKVSWRDASPEQLGDVRTWRLHGKDNPRRVSDSTWQRQAQAISSVYKWAATRGIRNPVPPSFDRAHRRVANAGGSYPRGSSVKWFTAAAIRRWIDLGLRGYLPDGSPDSRYRHRSGLRDSAFVRAAYGTGLRTQELGNLVLGTEWPISTPGPYATLHIGEGIAKGGLARKSWASAEALSAVYSYVQTDRRLAVEAANRHGDYARVAGRLTLDPRPDRAVAIDARGFTRSLALLTPFERQRLFTDRDGFLEPAQIWLTEQGMPLPHTRWNRIFDRANDRITALGVTMSRLTPHRLRHSFALKWFVIGRLLWMGRGSGLPRDEAEALRDEMGSEWFLVQTLLGHRSVETTRNVYLEPFIGLDIESLLSQVHDQDAEQLLTLFLNGHARVESHPSW